MITSKENSASEMIKNCFLELENTGIDYAILRKTDEVETGKAHDIDVVVDYSKIKKVLLILNDVAIKNGYKKILECDKDFGYLKTIHFASYNGTQIHIIHFDLFNHFSWNGFVVISNADLLRNIKKDSTLFSVAEQNEILTKLLSRLLYHGYVKEEYRQGIKDVISNNREKYASTLEKIFGGNLSTKIVEQVCTGDWQAIGNLKKELRSKLQCSKGVTRIQRLIFSLKRVIKCQGVMVGFLGTDESGKSAIIENLPKVLGNTFNEEQIKYYHWRPGFLKSPKGDKSASNVDASDRHKKKSSSKSVSLIKFMYFSLDYILGYWMSVKKHLIKNELVVFDHYYYDYLLDKYRYRLDVSDNIIRIVSKIISKPDITFLLYETPEEKKQLETIVKVSNIIPNTCLINVNRTIDEVVYSVSEYILKHMEE